MLRKDRVQVHISGPTQRVQATVAQEVALAFRRAGILQKILVHLWPAGFQGCNHFFAGCRRGGIGNGGSLGGKPFLFLQLHPFPGGVAQQAVKAAGPAGVRVVRGLAAGNTTENPGEGQMPVEETELARQPADLAVGAR